MVVLSLLIGMLFPGAREPEPAPPPAPEGTVIVLNKADASASFFGREGGEEIARVPVGVGPHEVAVSPDGRTAVVSNYGDMTPGQSLTVIDVATAKATSTIDLGDYRRPHGIAFTPDGSRVLVTCEVQQALLTVNVGEARVESALTTGQKASHMVALASDGVRAYVSNIASGTVTAFDIVKNLALATIATDAGAEGIDVSPDGREVWVANNKADNISIIEAESLKVVSTLPCPKFPIRVKFTPDGKHVLVSCAASGDLAVFDAVKRAELRRISMRRDDEVFDPQGPFGDSPVPLGIMVPPDGKHAYICNTRAGWVSVVDLATWAVTEHFKAGPGPDGIGFTQVMPES